MVKLSAPAVIISVIAACSSGPRRVSQPIALSPEHAAAEACATGIALNEGFEIPRNRVTSSLVARGRDDSQGESVLVRVALTPDSIFTNAVIRSATYSGRGSAPISPAARRIENRVNQECRLPRFRQ
jgi:hypothetical protein